MLLSRDEFRETCLKRDKRCVICGCTEELSVHHIIERRLFPDGGYHADNGASLCKECHLKAEMTVISVEDIRTATGITSVILPPGIPSGQMVDKWGNHIREDGSRTPGPLFQEDGVQKILKQGGKLDSFSQTRDMIKYPRTPHILGSKFQNGDEDMNAVPFDQIAGKHPLIS